MRPNFLRWLVLSPILFLSLGCGDGQSVKVSGKLVKGGAKYVPPEGHRLTITFVAVEAKDGTGKPITNEPFQAILDPDGESFSVPGHDGHGIPPGKYRVAITQRMTREAFDANKPKAAPGMPPVDRETDFLYDRFGLEKSPIVREVDGSKELIIDLDNPA